MPSMAWAQQIRGLVTDDRNTVTGVSVMLKMPPGTVTDAKGAIFAK